MDFSDEDGIEEGRAKLAAEQKGGRERCTNGEKEGLHAGREGWRDDRRERGRERGEDGSKAVSGGGRNGREQRRYPSPPCPHKAGTGKGNGAFRI